MIDRSGWSGESSFAYCYDVEDLGADGVFFYLTDEQARHLRLLLEEHAGWSITDRLRVRLEETIEELEKEKPCSRVPIK
jgi:hypothetical protein